MAMITAMIMNSVRLLRSGSCAGSGAMFVGCSGSQSLQALSFPKGICFSMLLKDAFSTPNP
jgi:hypothetical protein